MSDTSFLIECAKRLAGHTGHDWLCGSYPSESIAAMKMCTSASVPDDQAAELVQMLSQEIERLRVLSQEIERLREMVRDAERLQNLEAAAIEFGWLELLADGDMADWPENLTADHDEAYRRLLAICCEIAVTAAEKARGR